MNFSVYLFYELLIRLSDVRGDVGEYLSRGEMEDGWTLRTTRGSIKLSKDILKRQFIDPTLVTEKELYQLSRNFEPNY